MPDINEAFPSKFLKAHDLQGNRVTVTMDRVAYETINEERKAVLYFRGKDKGLVLNKTNANMIIELTGSALTEQWAGKRITLYPTRVDYQGKRVDAIRIDPAPTSTAQPPAPPPPPPPEPGWNDEGDGVPF